MGSNVVATPFTEEEERKFRVWWALAEGREKVDYAKNATAWRVRASHICEEQAIKRGIVNKFQIKQHITDLVLKTLDTLELDKRTPADQMRVLFIHLDRAIEKRRSECEMDANGVPFGHRMEHGLQGHYHLNITDLHNIMHEEDAHNRNIPQAIRLARVAFRCENAAYNRDGARNGHWFAGADAMAVNGKDFLEYAFGVLLKKGVEYKQWMLTLKQSVGNVATFYNLTTPYEEAIDKFDEFMDAWSPDNGDMRAVNVALAEEKKAAEQKALMLEARRQSDYWWMYDLPKYKTATELRELAEGPSAKEYFNRGENKVTTPATAFNTQTFWGRVNGQLNKYDAWRKANGKEREAFVHKVLNLEHIAECNLPALVAADRVISAWEESPSDKPKQNETAKNAPQTPETPSAATTTPETTNAPASADFSRSETGNITVLKEGSAMFDPSSDRGALHFPMQNVHPEIVIVYPMHNGSIVYGGVRFSVTLRAGGTFVAAKALMDEFVANKEFIDPSCLVVDESAGSFSEQGISLTRLVKNGKTTYEIEFNLSSGEKAERPILISTPQSVSLLEEALVASGVKIEKLENGRTFTNILVTPHWNRGKEMADSTPEKRKYYKDYTKFDVELVRQQAVA